MDAPRGGVVPVSKRVMNLAHMLRAASRRHGAETALVWGERQWTWGEWEARVAALAAGFTARGICKGDRVLVQSRNCNAMLETMFACFRVGAVLVPTNFRQTPAEVAALATTAGATALVCQAEFAAHAEAVRAAVSPRVILAIGDATFGEDVEAVIAANAGTASPMADVEYDDPCWFFFTSGTTGRPKAAVLTHGQMGFVVTSHLCDLMPGTTNRDASLVLAPLSHGAGVHALTQVARAAKTVMLSSDRLDVAEAWALVKRWRITNMFTVPTIVKLLVEHESVHLFDHSSLRFVIYAGAPMYREDQKRALATLGPVLVQYFGLGEVTGNITVLPPEWHEAEDGPHARIGTCGFERTAMQVSIQDDAGEERAPGETGEICVCGPGVFPGYYDNPEANAKAFRNGWFRTGDLGHVDAEGFLYITGRASDMYISGGSNIHPREVEEKLLTHKAILECAVFGVPDPTWGEVGVAVCVLRQGETLAAADLISWLGERITRYKLPRRVEFWEALPKSAYGKLAKKDIRAELARRDAANA